MQPLYAILNAQVLNVKTTPLLILSDVQVVTEPEPATFVQRLLNVFQTHASGDVCTATTQRVWNTLGSRCPNVAAFGTRWVVVVQTLLVQWEGSVLVW